jgi:hypothetical protein
MVLRRRRRPTFNNGIDADRNKHYRVFRMTEAFENISEYVFGAKAAGVEKRAIVREELQRMSTAMMEERGLLNHAQAADLLGVSLKRIWELVRLGKLKRFDFAGRTYVSFTEVCRRYDAELAAGERLKQSLPRRVLSSIQAAAKTDEAQWELGGYAAGYYEARTKSKQERRKSGDKDWWRNVPISNYEKEKAEAKKKGKK